VGKEGGPRGALVMLGLGWGVASLVVNHKIFLNISIFFIDNIARRIQELSYDVSQPTISQDIDEIV
jgi:arginine repressor